MLYDWLLSNITDELYNNFPTLYCTLEDFVHAVLGKPLKIKTIQFNQSHKSCESQYTFGKSALTSDKQPKTVTPAY